MRGAEGEDQERYHNPPKCGGRRARSTRREEQGKAEILSALCILRDKQVLMLCLLCRQAETADGLTSVHFERGEMRLVVKNVPARVCPSCGEAYVEEDVAGRLLRGADDMSAAGEMDSVIEYSDIEWKL